MANVAVVGSQWGDEGKGKLVDILAQHADYVCRWAFGASFTLLLPLCVRGSN